MRITRLKSQVDIEFITITAILLLMFLILLSFIIKRQQDAEDIMDFIEKRGECLRISSLVSSVFNDGSGTSVKTNTKYAILVYNDSITVKTVENVTVKETKIAVLASEAGESSQDFYNTATARLSPVWYKVCFSDLGGGSGCQQWQTPGITVPTWNSITKTLDNLVQDIDNYNVIYLEDAHLQYNTQYNGKTYLQIFQDWVSKGNILITAEHPMCREQNGGTFSSTSYQCNPPGAYNNDIWTIFGSKIHQRSGSYGHDVTVVMDPPQEYFQNLHKGDKYDFEENSYIELNQDYKKAYDGALTGTYSDSGGSYANSYNDDNSYWYFGSDNNYYNITGYAEITYNISALGVSNGDITNINFSVKYCHDGSNSPPARCDGDAAEGSVQGSQDAEIYNYSGNKWQNIGELRTNDNGHEIFGSFVPSGNLADFVSSKREVKIRYELNYYNGNSRDSFLVIDYALLNLTARNMEQQTIVGTYDADKLPAITYWNYGKGKVFYFGDFQVEASQSEYSQILSELIELASYFFITPSGDEVTCNYVGNVHSIGEFTGDIEINNTNDEIFITQYT